MIPAQHLRVGGICYEAQPVSVLGAMEWICRLQHVRMRRLLPATI